tara:strand:+ start:1148 stop:2464 length:1317 start_codon:yes stop_codon:yes gene_type:complete
MLYRKLLNILAALLCFSSTIVFTQTTNTQYLTDTEYWYGKGLSKKSVGSKYRMEARTKALTEIASQISSTIISDGNFQIYIKDGKTKKDRYTDTVKTHVNATIEFDIEDVEEKTVGREYSIVLRLNKNKYFQNRSNKRNNAIQRAGSILDNLDKFPSKSAVRNLNEIFTILLPYADEPLEYVLSSGEKVNLLGHTTSLARNYIDRISFSHSIEKYPLTNISDDFLFNISIHDRVTNQPLSQFEIKDKKENKILVSDESGIIAVKGKISDRSRFEYKADYKSIFPNFFIFELENKEFLIEEPIFKKTQSPSFNFVLHDDSKYIPSVALDVLQKDIKEKLYKKYKGVFNVSNAPDYRIVIDVRYDDFNKNQWNRYVCFLSVTYYLFNREGDEISSYPITGIRGISLISKDDALRNASENIINQAGGDEIFSKFSKAIHSS